METANTSSVASNLIFQTQNIQLKKCIKSNTILTLYFNKPNINFNITDVLLKNVKTRAEYSCDYILTKENLLIVDLSKLGSLFSDYEGEIVIISQTYDKHQSLIPVLSVKDIILEENDDITSEFKWYIRLTDNNRMRLSTITKKL